MRTHLLRAVYPLPAAMAFEPDTGNAANDESFAPNFTGPSRPQLIVVGDTAPAAALAADAENDRDDHDDYYLGGYAGI